MRIYTPITIDGTEITSMIERRGVNWSKNVIDGPNAGRTMSGLMIRDVVANKIRLDIKCRDLTLAQLRLLLTLIAPDFVTVSYNDPEQGPVTKTMYSNNYSATLAEMCEDGEEDWEEISFPLIER
jgi:hypothetical protein